MMTPGKPDYRRVPPYGLLGPMSDTSGNPVIGVGGGDVIGLAGERVYPTQEDVRRYQVKAAVTKEEKAMFEEVAKKVGIPLSILIRRELLRVAQSVGISTGT